MSRNYSLLPVLPPHASASGGCAPLAFSFGRPLPLGRVTGGASACGVHASPRRGRRLASADFSPAAVACSGGASSLSSVRCGAFRGALTLVHPSWSVAVSARPNSSVNTDAAR